MNDIQPEPAYGKWQPIETAPRDGRPIILFDGSDVSEAYYDRHLPGWAWANDVRVRGVYDLFRWTPLPEPPETGE